MQGHDPKVYHPPVTNQMEALLRKRDALLTDTFYKIAHYIFRTMRERNLSYLIVGKNNGWKQKVNIGHKNNQEFVNIPHSRFISILHTVSRNYPVKVFEQDESYTSKASFLDNDTMPETFNKSEKSKFSGKRIKRGLYKSGNGTLINADVNGAMNIGRKANKRIFDTIQDFSYLTKSISICRFSDLNPSAANN
jgi:putative transposase